MLQREIGKGAFGVVYQGVDIKSGFVVAVKVIPMNSLSARLVTQLERELAVMKKIKSPYVVQLYDVLKTVNSVYVVMEYCSGGDLESYRNSHPPSEPTIKRWLSNLVDAFATLQANEVLHRDLKLPNILLSSPDLSSAVAKVADFGFARFVSAATMAETVLGTPLFMAPEVLSRRPYSYKVDMWSLGVIAYELLVGKPAFTARTMEELMAAQQRPITFPVDCGLSGEAKNLISLMMKIDCEERPTFAGVRNHPFFTVSERVQEVSTEYEVIDGGEGGDVVVSTTVTAPVQTVSVQSPADSKVENALISLEYSCSTGLRTTLQLADKYVTLGKTLIAYAIYWMTKDEVSRYFSELDTVCTENNLVRDTSEKVTSVHRLLTASRSTIEARLNELQCKLSDADLNRSVLTFRDTGLYIEGRLLLEEAEALLCRGDREAVKEAVCLAGVASSDTAAERWAGEVMERCAEVQAKAAAELCRDS